MVINGIPFRVHAGVPWRDPPERFGSWKTVYERHRHWSADGAWDRILQAVLTGADTQGRIDWSMVSVDSTSCRAHQHAALGWSTPLFPLRKPGRSAVYYGLTYLAVKGSRGHAEAGGSRGGDHGSSLDVEPSGDGA